MDTPSPDSLFNSAKWLWYSIRTKLYVLIPAVAFALILLNAMYGHGVFSAGHSEDIAKYAIYVHLQPGWKSYPSNLLFDVTNVWENDGGSNRTYYDDPAFQPLDDHNYNQLQSIGDREFVELKHRFGDCRDDWQPILYRYGIDTLRTWFEVAAGATVSGHPYAVMYPNQSRAGPQDPDPRNGYVQFVPVCSSHEVTSYEYSVRSKDRKVPLDIFFVPAPSEYRRFIEDPDSFSHYPGCLALSHTSFSGTCRDVSGASGLLIWVPDELDLPLTTITVNLREVPAQ